MVCEETLDSKLSDLFWTTEKSHYLVQREHNIVRRFTVLPPLYEKKLIIKEDDEAEKKKEGIVVYNHDNHFHLFLYRLIMSKKLQFKC